MNPGSKFMGLLWLAAAILVAGAAAVGVPRMAKHVPWRVERWLAGFLGGRPARANLCQGRSHPESAALFRQLARRIYPIDARDESLPITFDVIRGNTVNAFAMYRLRPTLHDPSARIARVDALAAELEPLVGGPIMAMFKYDSDTAHSPQPPRRG